MYVIELILSHEITPAIVLNYSIILINSTCFHVHFSFMHKAYDERYMTNIFMSSYIDTNSNANLMNDTNVLPA